MTKSDWLKKAGKLYDTFKSEIEDKNGRKRITDQEATRIQELNHVVGSDHGKKMVSCKEAKDSLEKMILLVNSGVKDSCFTAE